MNNLGGQTTSYELYIATLSQTNVNYTIEQKSGIITNGTVSLSNPVIVSLSTSLVSLDSSYMYRNQGIHVHSDGQISLIVVNYRERRTGLYTAYPYQLFPILQYHYYALSMRTYKDDLWHSQFKSEILLVGNVDNTIISITPTGDIDVPIDIHSANSPTQTVYAGTTKVIKLDCLQTFLFAANNAVFDLSGTSIVSNQPLTVVSGHEYGEIEYDVHICCGNHVSEQIPPTVTWGKKFILTPYKGRSVSQTFKLTASETSTTIMHNCDTGVSTINLTFAGDVVTIKTNYTTYCYLESDKPLLIIQIMPGKNADGKTGGPSISIIFSIQQYKHEIMFIPLDYQPVNQHYINIIATQEGTMLMDGSVLSLSWNSISDLNDEVVGYAAQMTVTSLGAHVITSTNNVTFTVRVYGYGTHEGYAYTAGITTGKAFIDMSINR